MNKKNKNKKNIYTESVLNFMVRKLPVFYESEKVENVIKAILKYARVFDSINYIYVVDKNLKLKGVFSIKELLKAPKNKSIKKIMKKRLFVATPQMTDEDVALLALRHNLKSLPIVDSAYHLVGAYDPNELLDVLDKKISRNYLMMSGVGNLSNYDINEISSIDIAKARLPWLIVGIFGGIISAIVINFFKPTLESVVLLVLLLPMILGLGANIANQSAMIYIRNLITTDMPNAWLYIIKELKSSLIMSIIISAVVAILSYMLIQDVFVILVATFSAFLIVIASSMVGVVVPIILNKLKLDPSTGSGPFLTMIKDIVVILIYFTVATILFSIYYF